MILTVVTGDCGQPNKQGVAEVKARGDRRVHDLVTCILAQEMGYETYDALE